MRKLKLQMHATLDGCVAGPNGELDWMMLGEIDAPVIAVESELMNTSDTILMGHGMVSEFTTYWESVYPGKPDSPEYDFAHKMVMLPKIVFSRTVDSAPGKNVRVENGDLVEKVTALKNQEGKHLLVYGGAKFVASLIGHNLIDELNLFVHPIAIGEGQRIFSVRTKLKLIMSQPNPSGIVINTYVPDTPENRFEHD
jgi:dihydrofolate reductase